MPRHTLLLTALLLTACTRKTAPPSQDTTTTSTVAMTLARSAPQLAVGTSTPKDVPSPGAPLAWGKEGVLVTLGQFERAIAQSVFFAPDRVLAAQNPAPPEHIKHSSVRQVQTVQHLLEDEILLREAQQRGLLPSLTTLETMLAKDPNLSRFLRDPITTSTGTATPHTLESLGFSRADLHDVAKRRWIRQQMSVILTNEVTQEEVWGAWQGQHELARVLLISLSNLPTSQDIDLFTQTQTQAIKAHYDQHSAAYRIPPVATATLWLMPPSPDPAAAPADATLTPSQRKLKAAHAALLAGTASIDALAAELGLTKLPERRITPPEDPRLFAPGAAATPFGLSLGAPKGDYIWHISAITPGSLPPISRPLEREIASELLRQGASYPTIQASILEAKAILETFTPSHRRSDQVIADAATKALAPLGPELSKVAVHTIALRNGGFIPGMGSAPEFSEAIFAAPKRGAIVGPEVRSQYVWLGKVIERKHAKRQTFAKESAAFRATYLEQLAPQIVELRMPTWQQKYDLHLSLEPLKQKYPPKQKPQ